MPKLMPTKPGRSANRRRGLVRLGLCAVVLAGPFAVLIALQRSLIYHPRRETPDRVRAEEAFGSQLLPVEVPTTGGMTLHGWLIPAVGESDELSGSQPRDAVADWRPLAIWFCGNGGHRGHRLTDLKLLNQLGCHALIVDYRGYAENEGAPSESGIVADARDVWTFATKSLGVPAERILLFGESLGGGVAVQAAADLGRRGIAPRGLILEATFSSLVDAAAYHYPWLPVRWALIDRYESTKHIPDVKCPVLMLHGRKDSIVPFEQGRRLFEAAPPTSASGIAKEFVELPDADHNDILTTSADLWFAAIRSFLRRTDPISGSATAAR